MIIKIYDFLDMPSEVTIPDDKVISEIYVKVLSGDETGYFKFTDGTEINFDASNCRWVDAFDGEYTVVGNNIEKWINYDINNCSGTISYARQDAFEDLEDDIEIVEDEKMFTKNDLRTGDLVKYRNGDIGIVFVELGSILFRDDSYERLELFGEDLNLIHNLREYDIVAVRRPTISHECRFGAFEHDLGELVYVRDEVKVEEMTLEEVCEALGKKIKIIDCR